VGVFLESVDEKCATCKKVLHGPTVWSAGLLYCSKECIPDNMEDAAEEINLASLYT
jgi:hypothetical protein